MTSSTDEIEHEQGYVDHLYARLDALRARTAADLATVRRTTPRGTHQNRSERDAFARIYDHYFDTVYRYISDRVGSRTLAEDLTSEAFTRAHALCFGAIWIALAIFAFEGFRTGRARARGHATRTRRRRRRDSCRR